MTSPELERSPATPPARTRSGRFVRRYGAHPWHLAAVLGCLLLAAFTASRLLGDLPVLVRIGIWFVGAAVVWDLLLGPLLALVDAGLRRLRVGPVPPLNYLRFPGLLSLLLLVMFLPLIARRSEFVYTSKSGLSADPYLGRWLAVTAVLFALSGVAYAVAALRARRRV